MRNFQRPLILCALVFSFIAVTSHADESFTTVLYPVSPHLFAETIAPYSGYGGGDPFGGPLPEASGAVPEPDDPVADLAEMANLPEGSICKHFWKFGRIMVRTSPPGHQAFKKVLEEVDAPKPRISVGFTFIEIPTNIVTASEVFQRSGSLDEEEVLRLFREGKARLLSLTQVATLSGVNTQVEGVTEIIYPTEFKPLVQPAKNVPGAAGVAAAAPPPLPAVTPGAFETRESGHILNVTPTLSPIDPNVINLALIPESAILSGWIDFGAEGQDKIKAKRSARTAQPVFRSLNYTGSIRVTNGETAVVAGAPDPETGNLIYGLVTARLSTSK